ncbi:MAG: hypothetical protein U0401_13410 [Anaerolineae bacterium]
MSQPDDRLLNLYLNLERRVLTLRQKYDGVGSIEEEIYLDVMDLIWWKLTEQERDLLNSRPSDKRESGSS